MREQEKEDERAMLEAMASDMHQNNGNIRRRRERERERDRATSGLWTAMEARRVVLNVEAHHAEGGKWSRKAMHQTRDRVVTS